MGCRIHLMVFSLLTTTATSPLRAADPATPETMAIAAPVQTDVANLDSADPESRERSTTQLMTRPNLSSEELSAAFRNARSPEQRARLVRIATHRFFVAQSARTQPPDHDSGSLGVYMNDLPDQHRVVRPIQHPGLKTPAFLITATLPGFPAYAHLRPGDMIIAINGDPFGDDLSPQKFTERIKSFPAGETVKFDILRDNKLISARIRLDSLHRLQEVHQFGGRVQDFAPLQSHLQALAAGSLAPTRLTFNFPDVPFIPAANAQAPQPDNGQLIIRNGNGQIIIRGGINGRIRIRGDGQIEILP